MAECFLVSSRHTTSSIFTPTCDKNGFVGRVAVILLTTVCALSCNRNQNRALAVALRCNKSMTLVRSV